MALPMALLVGTGLLAGCATLAPIGETAPRPPLPAVLAAAYDYAPQPLTARWDPLGTEPSRRWQAQRVTLEGPGLPSPIRLDWYAPAWPGRHAAVLIFPILWGNDLGVRDFAQGFAREGIHGIIVYRPKETFSMERPLSQLEGHFRASVVQVRRTVDWLQTQPSVDGQRLGSLGISMGATLNILVASVEPRLTRYLFCLPASHLAHVIITTKDRSIAKKRDEYLRRHHLTPAAAEAALTETLTSEPLSVAGAIDPARALAVIALWDRVIGWQNSLAIWRALGRPPTLWVPTGHYTALLTLPYLQLRTLWFFRAWQSRRPKSAGAPERPRP